jgi:hypothetical protein
MTTIPRDPPLGYPGYFYVTPFFVRAAAGKETP